MAPRLPGAPRARRWGKGPGGLAAVAVGLILAVGVGVSAPRSAGASPARSSSDGVSVMVHTSRPGGAINENLSGINHVVAGSQPSLQAIGTRFARTDVSFEITTGAGPAYDCATRSWNPSYLDSQVALDEEAGAAPELIVDYTPPCLATDPPAGVNPNYTPPDIGPDQAKWQALVYQMALHEITDEGVRVFEVWNEPNLGQFWTGGLAGYLTLYQDTAKALEEAAATASVTIEVGGPALAEFQDLETSWVKALASYAVSNDLPLDFVSWHLYADDPDVGPSDAVPNGFCFTGPGEGDQPCWDNPELNPDLYSRQVHQVRRVLAGYPSLHPQLWIDEWNINVGEDVRIDGPYGAAFVAAVLQEAQASGLDRLSFFDAADDPVDPTQNWGLLFSDLSPKPAYFAMLMWSQLAGRELPVTVDARPRDGEGQIEATASIAPGGTIHVLVDNFAPYDATGNYGTSDPTPYDHAVDVEFPPQLRGDYQVSRTVVDATEDGSSVASVVSSGALSRVQFTLAGQGVTLLTLSPTSGG